MPQINHIDTKRRIIMYHSQRIAKVGADIFLFYCCSSAQSICHISIATNWTTPIHNFVIFPLIKYQIKHANEFFILEDLELRSPTSTAKCQVIGLVFLIHYIVSKATYWLPFSPSDICAQIFSFQDANKKLHDHQNINYTFLFMYVMVQSSDTHISTTDVHKQWPTFITPSTSRRVATRSHPRNWGRISSYFAWCTVDIHNQASGCKTFYNCLNEST